MGLKVIGAGFGRTGTDSLKEALNKLGLGPCHHMKEMTNALAGKLLAVKQGDDKNPDWDALLGDYKSAVDWPWSFFYKELAEKYPDAKVVLTLRDPERWHESAANTIFKMSAWIPPCAIRRMIFAIIWDGVFGGRFEEKEYAMETFNKHVEEVKKNIPADRLLVFQVKDGWAPLCEFLQVPVPDGPFPKVNASQGPNASWSDQIIKHFLTRILYIVGLPSFQWGNAA